MMKIRLRLDFDSITEMQDWIVAEAKSITNPLDVSVEWAVEHAEPRVEWTEDKLTYEVRDDTDRTPKHVPPEVAKQIEDRAAEVKKDQVAAGVPMPGSKSKPKRKRRTKAEMAAARAAEEAAKKESIEQAADEDVGDEHLPEPPAEVEPVKSNGDLLRDFQVLLENPSVANQAIAVLDDVAAAQPAKVKRQFSSPVRFSDLPEAAQVQVIEQARGLL